MFWKMVVVAWILLCPHLIQMGFANDECLQLAQGSISRIECERNARLLKDASPPTPSTTLEMKTENPAVVYCGKPKTIPDNLWIECAEAYHSWVREAQRRSQEAAIQAYENYLRLRALERAANPTICITKRVMTIYGSYDVTRCN